MFCRIFQFQAWTRNVQAGLAFCLWLCWGFVAGTSAALALTTDASISTAPQLEVSVWHEQTGQSAWADIQAGAAKFETWDLTQSEVHLGYSDTPVWVRVRIHRQETQPSIRVLEIPYHGLASVEFFMADNPSLTDGRVDASVHLEHRFAAIPVELKKDLTEVYIRVQSNNALTVPLRLWASRDFLSHVQKTSVLQALYFGALLVMVVYNLFLALSLRDRRFAGYVVFAMALGMGMLSGNGYGLLYFWTDWPEFDDLAQEFFLYLAAALSIDFSRCFLQLKQRWPLVNKVLLGGELLMVTLAFVLLSSLVWSFDRHWINKLVAPCALLLGVLILVAGVRQLVQAVHGIRFFMLAWSILWLGVFVATFRIYGWVPSNVLTMYAIQIASAFEMLLLAFALADIVHQERSEREVAQLLSLRLKDDMVRQLRLSEEHLEKAVETRTQQFQEAVVRQRQLLDQYVRFGAMISHEFRNPLGIIQSQTSLLRKLQQPTGQPETTKRLDIISSATKRLVDLFDRWLQGGKLQQLGDNMHLQTLDLSSWLQDLLAVRPEYQADHQVLLQHEVADPRNAQVCVDESLLEIAVLNLLDNACKYSPPGTAVTVRVSQRAGQVGIAIQDQGPGIPEAVQQSIFEDYVRLQPEGAVRGMGLGLALVKRIGELLNAQIELTSQPGQGSCFSLWLPRISTCEQA